MKSRYHILFLYPYPYDEVASQRFRFEQYYPTLEERKISYATRSFYPRWAYRELYQKKRIIFKSFGTLFGFIKRIFHLFACLHADFIFVHRELTPVGPPIFEWIISRVMRKKMIYDFDDAIWMPNTSEVNRLIRLLKWHHKFSLNCTWSYKISCCNDYLAKSAARFNSNIAIIPTSLNTKKYVSITKPQNKDQIILGWTGTHSTLPYLNPLKRLIKEILEEHPNVYFKIICNQKPDWDLPKLQFAIWDKAQEIDDLSDIDIGIMPLPDSDWAKGKCGFKILQYFSLGIPAVASSVGMNKEIISDGVNGYLCVDEEAWKVHIRLLIESKDLRIRLGKNGRKTVEENYSLEANKTNFLGLFE
jgi:glycosyltransferase involved in cell wall biosynthesis